ncbi:MAG TPA: hypothetical protein VF702_13255 [Allosphingosinicella sp.]|jgi:hypothetical protein
MTADDIETADRLGRWRARLLPALAVIFIAQQGAYFMAGSEDGTRTVDLVRIGAWLFLSAVLLVLLITGGALLRSRNVRNLLNDDVTRANRSEALRLGFIATMLGGMTLYVISLFEPVSGREAIHLLMTVGIAGALIRFGYLERRALGDV